MCADAFGYIRTKCLKASAGIIAIVLSTDARATMSGCIDVDFRRVWGAGGDNGSLRLKEGGAS
jgi:hypothetical protein